MLAAIRNLAWGASVVMAGFLVVMLANRSWIALSWPRDATYLFFFIEVWGCFSGDWTYMAANVFPATQSLVGIAVVAWLVVCAIQRGRRGFLSA